MIRAAHTSFCLALFLAASAFAQDATPTGPADDAVREAVRRQAFTVELRQKIGEAGVAEQHKDLAAAGKAYQQAVDLADKAGSGAEAEMKAAAAGVSRVNAALAQQAAAQGDYKETDTLLKAALAHDGKNPLLLSLKQANDVKLAEQAGRVPSSEVLDRVPGIMTNKVKVATMVQDGKLLYELGKWDEADAKLKQAIALEPDNQAAVYYLKLVQEARYRAQDSQRQVQEGNQIVEIENAWQTQVQREMLPVPNPYARTNAIHTGAGRQSIISKLDRIQLNDVKYDGMELSEVVRNLSDEAKKRDPDKAGINFIILADTGAAAPATPGAVDPATGLPAAALPTETVDVGAVHVKITPALSNVRLADVLDAIVKTAEKPIKYSIEDYAIVFSLKTAEPMPLYTRTFRVDPNTFVQGLESVGATVFGAIATSSGGSGGSSSGSSGNNGSSGSSGNAAGTVAAVQVAGGSGGNGGGNSGSGIAFVTRTNNMQSVQNEVKAFFTAAGVVLDPPKALFFNDRKGILFVRATLQDLDIIEAAIQTLNVTPPQVNIRAKFAEVDQTDSRALGFDWYLGNTLLGNGEMGLQGGTAPQYAGVASFANPNSAFPDATAIATGASSVGANGLLTSGLRNTLGAPALATLTGIMTDPQFRTVVSALAQRSGTDILDAPEVTTVSGRQTHIEVTDMESIVTGVNANQTASSSGTGTGGNTGAGAVGSTITYNISTLPFGPSLDVVPYVSADEYTIQMTIIPTLTEFLGYDNPGAFAVQAQGSSGGSLTAALPLPHSRVRQVTTTAVVWDGQTVVLGGLITESTTKTKDKVPLLGDLPMVGQLFRSESNMSSKKNLLIFVTPTIIDPAGNRMHSEDEMPFAQTGIPPQSAPVAH
jgi:general secretion pathway protein D